MSYLGQDHSRDLLGGELLGLAEVLNLNLGVSVVIHDLEGPGLHILLDGGVIEAATDQSPGIALLDFENPIDHQIERTYLTSKTVLMGFMAAWFLAASPINRSESVNETNEGVVKEPCSLAMISTLLPS